MTASREGGQMDAGLSTASLQSAIPGVDVEFDGRSYVVRAMYPLIGTGVDIRLAHAIPVPGRAAGWIVSITVGGEVTTATEVRETQQALPTLVWTCRMLRSRLDELLHLLNTGVVPRCVNNCSDLHNFVDWNLAGDADELLEAAAKIAVGADASPMDWPCTILNSVDGVIDGWLRLHAEPLLAPGATLKQMAGLLVSRNAAIEKQVAARFLRLRDADAREFLREAAGRDGSNLTTKVTALVRAAAGLDKPGQ